MRLLALAIVDEVVATSALRASDGFTRLIPSIVVVVGYGVSFYLLSLTLRSIPVGIVYAVWSGAGIVLITAVAAILFGQIPDWPAVLGMGLIVSGGRRAQCVLEGQRHTDGVARRAPF